MFSQLLERALFLRGQKEGWQNPGGVIRHNKPTLGTWIKGWKNYCQVNDTDWRWMTLDKIRDLRNDVVHHGASVTQSDLNDLWGLMPAQVQSHSMEAMRLM